MGGLALMVISPTNLEFSFFSMKSTVENPRGSMEKLPRHSPDRTVIQFYPKDFQQFLILPKS